MIKDVVPQFVIKSVFVDGICVNCGPKSSDVIFVYPQFLNILPENQKRYS